MSISTRLDLEMVCGRCLELAIRPVKLFNQAALAMVRHVEDLQVLVIVEALVLRLEQLIVELCPGIVHSVKDSCSHLHGPVNGPVFPGTFLSGNGSIDLADEGADAGCQGGDAPG